MATSTIDNRKAFYDYEVLERLTAGIVLFGGEVRAIRDGMATLRGGYVDFSSGEAVLVGMYISAPPATTGNAWEPNRHRRLLITRRERDRLAEAVRSGGLTVVPLSAAFDARGMLKVDIGLCRGKRSFDKRAAERKKSDEKEATSFGRII